jgi:hypothetical protein
MEKLEGITALYDGLLLAVYKAGSDLVLNSSEVPNGVSKVINCVFDKPVATEHIILTLNL